MSDQRPSSEGKFRIDVSEDRLVATLHIEAGFNVPSADVLAAASALKLAKVDETSIAEAIKSRKPGPMKMVIAQGTPAQDERTGRVDYKVPIANDEQGTIAKVMVGLPVGTVGPVIAGADGVDVFGHPIAHKKAGAFTPGAGLSLVKNVLTATAAGNLGCRKGVLAVRPLLELYGETEAATTPVNFSGDISIKGCLRDGRSLQTTGSLVVSGAIEAAQFKVDGNVSVKGGVIGRDKGSGEIGGDLWCRFIKAMTLSVEGNMHIQSEIANSKIACSGRLSVARGPIIGGEVAANGGIDCLTLGNRAGVLTIIEVGSDRMLMNVLDGIRPTIAACRKRAAEIREKIAPLMSQLKNLTPQQREKATELMYDADEMEEAAERQLTELTDRCRTSVDRSKAEVLVTETVYPGVVIRFPGVEAVIGTAIMGPVRIVPRNVGNISEVVVEEPGGAVCPLASTQTMDHFSPLVERIRVGQRAA